MLMAGFGCMSEGPFPCMFQMYSIFVCVLLRLFSYTFQAVRTMPAFRHFRVINGTSPDGVITVEEEDVYVIQFPFTMFVLIEVVVLGVFLLEMLLRFLCWPSKLLFFADVLNWADIFGVLVPFIHWLLLFFDIKVLARIHLFDPLMSALVSFRLFRMFRIWRCFDAYRALMLAIKYSVKDLFLTFGISFILIMFFSLTFYAASKGQDIHYRDVKDVLWMVIVTMTTVGYGDTRPIDTTGKIVGSVCALSGILVLVLPLASLVNNYIHAWNSLKVAAVLRKYKSSKSKEYLLDVTQPGTPMYPILPPEAGMQAATAASSTKDNF